LGQEALIREKFEKTSRAFVLERNGHGDASKPWIGM
jgi:hypothetical protein